MSDVTKLKAALAAAPVREPCTAAAVGVLHKAGVEAAQRLAYRAQGSTKSSNNSDAFGQQQLPGACMPVLAWLAAGLRSGLLPAATQQAHQLACALLEVVVGVLPADFRHAMDTQQDLTPQLKREANRLLKQLGPTEVMCQQLADVMSALVAAAVPATPTGRMSVATAATPATAAPSSAAGNCRPPPALQQQAALAQACKEVCLLLSVLSELMGKDAAVAAITASGLYQTMLEATVMLLGVDPAAYPQGMAEQDQVWGSLVSAHKAAVLLETIGNEVFEFWDNPFDDRPGAHLSGPGQGTHASSGLPPLSDAPWLRPLFKLHVLLLAKMQWDARQCPERVASLPAEPPWPAKALTRAVAQMISPCVAGDLLRQRAPGLLPHVRSCRHWKQTLDGYRREVVEVDVCCPLPGLLSSMSLQICSGLKAIHTHSSETSLLDAQELGLLLEVCELYCLACPSSKLFPLSTGAWCVLVVAVAASSAGVLASFFVTCGAALVEIAEYLVDNVLPAAGSAGAAAAGACESAPSKSSSGWNRFSSSSSSSSSTTTTRHSMGPCSSGLRSSSGSAEPGAARLLSARQAPTLGAAASGSAKRRTTGGRNPGVTAEHRLIWAQEYIVALNIVLVYAQSTLVELQGQAGELSGAAYSLLNSSTAAKCGRLLEMILRTPAMLGPRIDLQCLLDFLPRDTAGLHAAASSPKGSAALLSAITSAAKRQRVTQAALAALAQAGGVLAPAAAAVVVAVPGAMGCHLAEQLMQQPGLILEHAFHLGLQLTDLAILMLSRAAALVDPMLAPAAAYLATRLPPGQNHQLWGLEVLLTNPARAADGNGCAMPYVSILGAYVDGVLEQLEAAVACQQAGPAARQAAQLAKAAGGMAAEAELLRQQLQSMLLERDADDGPGINTQAPGVPERISADMLATMAASIDSEDADDSPSAQLPLILGMLCKRGLLQLEEVLAAGDPAQWAAAVEPPSPADLQVAATALLAACKAAGAVAQLPQMLGRAQLAMAKQPWGEALLSQPSVTRTRLPYLQGRCSAVAEWAVLLVPLLKKLLPTELAAQLQQAAGSTPAGDQAGGAATALTPESASRVLGLLGHVVVPGAPGCSYPGCCNLEGRTEAELPLQVCCKCKGVRYCCREHQVAHWKAGHKEVCQAAQAAAQQVRDAAAGRVDQENSSK